MELGYSQNGEKETHYTVITNAVGDVVALYTSDGIRVGTYSYDPYGGITEISHNDSFKDTDGILEKNPFRYRSYYYDTETGWYYLNSRYYDPQVKRFINGDSTQLLTNAPENLMQYNLFMYCNGDPICLWDKLGNTPAIIPLIGIVVAGSVVGGLVGAYTASASGSNVKIGAVEGALLGGVGTACAVFAPVIMASLASALAEAGASVAIVSLVESSGTVVGAIAAGSAATLIDYEIQYQTQGGIIDKERIVRTSIETAFCASFPCFNQCSFAALGTALAWGEGSVLVGFVDSIYSDIRKHTK